jgi:hypothetical protein
VSLYPLTVSLLAAERLGSVTYLQGRAGGVDCPSSRDAMMQVAASLGMLAAYGMDTARQPLPSSATPVVLGFGMPVVALLAFSCVPGLGGIWRSRCAWI